MPDFQTQARFTHSFLKHLHSQSPDGINSKVPVSVVMHGYLDVMDPMNSISTRMEFTSPALSKVICFGEHYAQTGTYQVTNYYEDGEEVLDDARCATLERFFVKESRL